MKTVLLFYLSILTILPSFASTSNLVMQKKGDTMLKVCSCELLKLINSDSKIELVAILAEKTIGRKAKLDYRVTAFELWKEKKYLAAVFVNGIKVIDKVHEITPCENLYRKLKEKYNELKLQSIIDVDARMLVIR